MTDYTIATEAGTVIAQVNHIDLDEEFEDEPVALTEKDVAYNLQEMLYDAIFTTCDADGNDVAVQRSDIFSESGMLTMNEGLTVRFKNGQEFQLTIVQSR